MRFEWDEAKRIANLKKHGIDFLDAIPMFDGDTVTVEDSRYDYGETRFISLGMIKGRVIVVIHTEQEQVIRIISARKATRYEELRFFEEITD
jgi:uncharacterized protein